MAHHLTLTSQQDHDGRVVMEAAGFNALLEALNNTMLEGTRAQAPACGITQAPSMLTGSHFFPQAPRDDLVSEVIPDSEFELSLEPSPHELAQMKAAIHPTGGKRVRGKKSKVDRKAAKRAAK